MRYALRSGIALAAVALAIGLAGCRDDNPVYVRNDPPAAPRAVYSVTGDGEVAIHWVGNTESDLAGYRVYRGPAYEGPFNPIGTTTSTSFVDHSVINGDTYYYAVAAYDQAGQEGDLSVENVFDTPRPAGTNVSLGPAANEPAGPAAGYDFSLYLVRPSTDAPTDMYFDVLGGTRLMIARDVNTDIQDAGFHVLDDLDWAPGDGWSPTGTVELILGHAYYVWTRDNHYAKFRVTALSNSQVRFDWAYQVDPGNPELIRHPRVETAAMIPGGPAVR